MPQLDGGPNQDLVSEQKNKMEEANGCQVYDNTVQVINLSVLLYIMRNVGLN